MEKLKLPELDLKALEEKAKEFAMKGAVEEIKDYYSGYNSPFRKKIKEELENKTANIHLDLPDIIGLINESLTNEIDRIANDSIAESFVPLATHALTRIDKDLKLSEILKEFVDFCSSDFKDGDRPSIEIKESVHGWLDVTLSYTDFRSNSVEYSLTFHGSYKQKGKYQLLSLPRTKTPHSYTKVMKLSSGESTIEMPFTRDTLQDKFTAYIANIVISKCLIEMDCDDFDDEF